nr:ORF32 [Human gammaherpesvirus 8]
MDAHAINERYVGPRCHRLAHVVLPRTFLLHHAIPLEPEIIFSTYTRFSRSPGTSRRLVVCGKCVLPGEENQLASSPSGLALSLPLFSHDGNFHPFDISVLRISCPGSNLSVTVRFLYLSLVVAMGAGRHNARSPTVDGVSPPEGTVAHPLEELQRLARATPDPAPTRGPLQVLTGLLRAGSDGDRATHHMALEAPGTVRGESLDPPASQKGPARTRHRPPPVRLSFNPVNADVPATWRDATNVYSGAPYYVCVYERGDRQEDDWLPIPLSFPEEPVPPPPSLVFMDDLFINTKQCEFVDTLEAACRTQGYTLRQRVPVAIPRDAEIADAVKSHFLEACLVLRGLASEASAWIRAATSPPLGRHACWMDVLGLWESRPHTLGLELRGVNCGGTDGDWSEILKQPDVQKTVSGSLVACVIVTPALEAWLVLPGGFAIKGRYRASKEDLVFIRGRYG